MSAKAGPAARATDEEVSAGAAAVVRTLLLVSKADGPVAVAAAATVRGTGPRRTLKVGHRDELRDRFRNYGDIFMATDS